MIISLARYRVITGDSTTSDALATARIEEATELLEDALDRELAEASRTESLFPTRDGRLWPRCTPITSAGGWTIDGETLIGPFGPGWPNDTGRVSVTYTGGFVERTANPTATNRLPSYVERDIAFAALALAPPTTSSVPAGAVSVRLGDAAVTFGPNGAPAPGVGQVRWSRRTLSWRYRVDRSA